MASGARALFGRPADQPVAGGLQVTVYLVPVVDAQVVAFDVRAPGVEGRFLPWAIIGFGQNPYEAASLLADDWLDAPLDALAIADVLSLGVDGGGWELAIVFRAVLRTLPPGDANRRPLALDPAAIEQLGPFAGSEIRRWAGSLATATATDPTTPRLVF